MAGRKPSKRASILGIVIAVLAFVASLAVASVRVNQMHERLTGEIDALESDLSAAEARTAELQRQVETERAAREQAEVSLRAAEDAAAHAQDELQSLEAALSARIQQLETAVRDREQQIAAAVDEKAKLQSELAHEMEQRRSFEEEIASIREQVQQQDATPVVQAAGTGRQDAARAGTSGASPNVAAKQQFNDDEPVERERSFDTPPKPLELTPPEYPRELRQLGTGGHATVAFLVDAQGRVQDVEVQDTSEAAFGEAAVAAVRTWRFKPAMRDGRPVEVRISQKLRFNSP